jgi:hypothetical protein
MHGVVVQGSGEMQHTQRDPLVGAFYIVRGEDGKPTKAGRVNTKTEAGDYIVRVWFSATGSAPYGETVPPTAVRGWFLYTNETSWRAAFARMQ